MLEALETGGRLEQSSGDKVIFATQSSKVNIENLLASQDRKIKK